jgi:hypothetical protein
MPMHHPQAPTRRIACVMPMHHCFLQRGFQGKRRHASTSVGSQTTHSSGLRSIFCLRYVLHLPFTPLLFCLFCICAQWDHLSPLMMTSILTRDVQLTEAFPTAPENEAKSPGRPPAMAMEDLQVLFLTKVCLGTPYYALSKQFGVDDSSAQRNILCALRTFNDTVGKRLFHLQHADTVRANLPQDWPERFKDTLLIGDGYPKPIKKSGTFVIQRITWSVYKHTNIYLTVICRYLDYFLVCYLV